MHAFLAFWQNVDVSKFSSAVPCLFSETSAFSEFLMLGRSKLWV
ncbi:hypothetical protein BFV96_4976 [Alteromonas macleodii]|nr:hypothetical protein BFV96_4976 [Alteromonas macleodii]